MFMFKNGALDGAVRDTLIVSGSSPQYCGVEVISGIGGLEQAGHHYFLAPNYPNPFNPSTTISFELPKRERANLAVYNIEGKLVATLVDETLNAGFKEVTWHGKDARGNQVSTGVYFYRLTAGKRTIAKKMVLLK
jgi:hypothetical protein